LLHLGLRRLTLRLLVVQLCFNLRGAQAGAPRTTGAQLKTHEAIVDGSLLTEFDSALADLPVSAGNIGGAWCGRTIERPRQCGVCAGWSRRGGRLFGATGSKQRCRHGKQYHQLRYLKSLKHAQSSNF
jgi:hypothetical protein